MVSINGIGKNRFVALHNSLGLKIAVFIYACSTISRGQDELGYIRQKPCAFITTVPFQDLVKGGAVGVYFNTKSGRNIKGRSLSYKREKKVYITAP